MQIECIKLTSIWKEQLYIFLKEIEKNGEDHFFSPHPFTLEEIEKIIKCTLNDKYYIIIGDGKIHAYGFLRGWDEGFIIPSLGIATHPLSRGIGLGSLLMIFLHTQARLNGATTIRLRVRPSNTSAINMYKKLGYKFETEESSLLVGKINI